MSLLTPTEVAKQLRIKRETLAIWRCTGRHPQLTFIRVGRAVRYKPEVVDAFLRQCEVRAEVAA